MFAEEQASRPPREGNDRLEITATITDAPCLMQRTGPRLSVMSWSRRAVAVSALMIALGLATAACGRTALFPIADGGAATDPLVSVDGGTAACPTASTLKEAASCTGRLMGTALSTRHFQDRAYTANALEFDYVTPENEMKWNPTEPTQGQFTFDAGDQIVGFASENGMSVKGHNLVWYNQLPSWVASITDASTLRSAMISHIRGVMRHYQGQVIAWDVVNEAWDDANPTTLRDSVFSRLLGTSYIDDAFTTARATDPSAKLFYNDYGTEGLSEKSNSVYAMVKDMKSRGIPIDGVGLQMHWRSLDSALTAADVAANMQRLADLGVEIVISEMDVQLCDGGTLADQQARFHEMVAVCAAQPKCTAVTVWGITDLYSWLNYRTGLGCTATETPSPLLLDDGYARKPAYTGVMDALLGQ